MCRHNGRQIAIATWICWTCNECVFFWNARIVAKQDSSNQLYQVQWKNWSGKWWINKKWILLGKKLCWHWTFGRVLRTIRLHGHDPKNHPHTSFVNAHMFRTFFDFNEEGQMVASRDFDKSMHPLCCWYCMFVSWKCSTKKPTFHTKKCAWRNSITHSRILRILYVS